MFVIWTTAGRTELATVWIAVEKSLTEVVCAWSGAAAVVEGVPAATCGATVAAVLDAAAPLVAEQAASTRTMDPVVRNRRTESS
jgi:hypothetical protein